MHKLSLPKLPKPSLKWLKKTPRQQDDNEEAIPINQRGLQAPPNSPRGAKPVKQLFGTAASKTCDTRHQRLHDSSSGHSSDDTTRSQEFFDGLVSIDPETIAPIAEKPPQDQDRSHEMRHSLRSIKDQGNERHAKRSGHKTETIVPLEPEIQARPSTLQGLELKRAAAVLDPDHPLDMVCAFNAWLATEATPTEDPLRLKQPAKGKPFMSRSLHSGQLSFKEHDAGKDLPEQVAAYTLLDDLSKVQSADSAVSDALTRLRTYLTKLALGTAYTVAGSHTYRQVLDMPELRNLMKALEKALLTNQQNQQNQQTITNFRPEDDPNASSTQSSGHVSLEDEASQILIAALRAQESGEPQ